MKKLRHLIRWWMLADALRLKIQTTGMSMRGFAYYLNLPTSTLSRVCAHKPCDAATMLLLCSVCKIDPMHLLYSEVQDV